ncbi:FSH1 domain-containing protein [Phanerochaete sordida]|uniref:FSH1 domain-containing protein n=1 Tax=Phanerochaete sordida TaxID=48140 RepID=A0A9P3GB26_9APHY|nr:FSH1 domain-containing protein [Phanerochaete sordida]
MATKKVLVLHGYAQSATIFSKRLGALRKACKGIDFVFLDAPHVLSPVDLAETFNTPEELGAPEAAESDPALQPRGWWKVDRTRTKMTGIEETFALLRDTLSKDHYDGVFGFSQGAAMAAMLAALLEKPHVFPDFLIDGKPPHEPLSFCIAAAGFRPRGELSDALFLPSYSTPTLHVLGRNDVIVVEERSKTLLDVSSNKRVEWHDGGHFVPSKANWRNFLRDYIKNPGMDVPSPGGAAVSEPASGVATPSEPAL